MAARGVGIVATVDFCSAILKTPFGFAVFEWLGTVVSRFLDFSDAGAEFVFGENFTQFSFAFKVLPTIVFFSSFIGVCYHWIITTAHSMVSTGNDENHAYLWLRNHDSRCHSSRQAA